MKKLLFTLVAAAAGGVASAVAPTATFDGLTAFDPTKTDAGTVEVDNNNPGYWEVDTESEPELTIVALSETDKYLQLNTGSTPLWRTFNSVGSALAATNATATLDAAGYDADVTIVSSDVKLTACTEWPTLTDFANEKLALFLFAPEEGDTSGKTNGLYAVGGAMVDGNLTATAYRLNADPNAITNTDGWATIAIKSYADVYVNNNGAKYPAFVIAACEKGSTTTNILKVAADEAYAPGFVEANLSNAAKVRILNRELIPSAKTSDGTLQGLGFQGEGGIDNVNLAAAAVAGMADAVTMTVVETGATVTNLTGGTLADGVLSFNPGATITFKVDATEGYIVEVMLGETALTADAEGVYSFAAVADAELTVTASAPLFEVGGVGYANFAAVITAIDAGTITGGEIDLLADASAGEDGISLEDGEYTIDLNGFTLSAEEDCDAIFNDGAIVTIIDSSDAKTGKVVGPVYNAGTMTIEAGTYEGEVKCAKDGTLTINDGTFEVALVNSGTLAINDGKFKATIEATLPDGMDWSETKDKDGYYTLVEDAGEEPEVPSVPEVPTVDEEVGEVVETEDGEGNKTATVTVTNASTSVAITIPSDYAGTVNVVVPPTVDTITGLGNASLTIKYENTDITRAFTMTTTGGTTTIALNENGVVRMTDGEEIPVKPALAATDADGVAVAPFEVGAEGDAAANVAAIPGLTYELETTDDLANDFGQITGNDEVVLGAKKKATGKRVKLEDKRSNKGAKGFYRVKVTK